MGVYVFNKSSGYREDGKRNYHKQKSEDEIIRIPGGIPAIIEPDSFKEVQVILKSRKIATGSLKAMNLIYSPA